MERIKRCQNCSSNNSASSLFCERCGADISRLPIEFVDSEEDTNAPIASEITAVSSQDKTYNNVGPQYVRICRCCGKVLVLNSLLCAGCGTELTQRSIIATEGKISADYASMLDETGLSKYSISIFSGRNFLKTTKLPFGLSVFGRIHLDELDGKSKFYQYVSEIHCLILTHDNSVEIIDVSRNGTFFNSEKIKDRTPVGDGDSVTICGEDGLNLVFKKDMT